MARGGRFGKYGEYKRKARLRRHKAHPNGRLHAPGGRRVRRRATAAARDASGRRRPREPEADDGT